MVKADMKSAARYGNVTEASCLKGFKDKVMSKWEHGLLLLQCMC